MSVNFDKYAKELEKQVEKFEKENNCDLNALILNENKELLHRMQVKEISSKVYKTNYGDKKFVEPDLSELLKYERILIDDGDKSKH